MSQIPATFQFILFTLVGYLESGTSDLESEPEIKQTYDVALVLVLTAVTYSMARVLLTRYSKSSELPNLDGGEYKCRSDTSSLNVIYWLLQKL